MYSGRSNFVANAYQEALIEDRLTLLADVAGIVSRSHDLDETLDNVVDLVSRRLEVDLCSIYLSDLDRQRLNLAATNGLTRESVGKVSLAFGEGLVGLAAGDAAPVYASDAINDPRARLFPETGEDRYQTLLAAPLRVGQIVAGVLVVQTLKSREFTEGDIALLDTCTQLISPTVVNAHMLSLPEGTTRELDSLTQQFASGDRQREKNFELRGSATSPGVAIGAIHYLEDPLELDRLEYVPSSDPAREREDLLAAVEEALRELHGVRDEAGSRFGPEFSAIFNTHIQILEDKGFMSRLGEAVDETENGITAIRKVRSHYAGMFSRMQDVYFRERGVDVEDVARRIASKLLGVRRENFPVSEGAILVTESLLPAHFALIETDRIAALVSERGGPNSHGAIFARALEIPTVTGATGITSAMRSGELSIVDGSTGSVFLSPDENLQIEFERVRERYALVVDHLDALKERPSETLDGHRILLTANAGLLADLRHCDQHGAEGIGLFRTELLALVQRRFPPESEQRQLYERVANSMSPRPVTIRTLDLGGDKGLPGLEQEENPQLGLRSIRLSLSNEEAFRTQLRAILKASVGRNIRLLLPMISSIEELIRARDLIEKSKEELSGMGLTFDETLPVGVMIEVPSAALIASSLAEYSDFFSIGTNDLTQYTLAVDRGNERVAHLYDALHPSVLSLIQMTAAAGRERGIPVSVCGEMATSPLAIPLLVGLGIGELSGTPSAVPIVKEIVRSLRYADLQKDAAEAVKLGTVQEVHQLCSERLRSSGLLQHAEIGPWLARTVEKS